MNHSVKITALIFAPLALISLHPLTVYALPGITTEAVDDYSACNGPSLPNSISDAQGFKAGMLNPSWNVAGYTNGWTYTDNSVWTTDFYDPERTLYSDQDNIYFDRENDTFSYFAGHGSCDVGDTSQYCTSGSTCTSPPSGAVYPSFCLRKPGDSFGKCSYTKRTRALLVGNCTNGGGNIRGGVVNYSHSSAWVKWGESPFSGSWASAGTNGGTNVVVLHSSCAEMSNRGQEVWAAFGGIHLLANVLVHTGDTANVADRGSGFATEYAINPYGAVSYGWIYGMNNISQRNSWCTNESGSTSYGGGFGENGCGGHVITAMGASSTEAVSHINENWYDVQQVSRDAKGASYWTSRWICNYDCNAWPFAL